MPSTFGDILDTTPADAALTEEVRQSLKYWWRDATPQSIVTLNSHELQLALQVFLPNPGYTNDDRQKVATGITALLSNAGYTKPLSFWQRVLSFPLLRTGDERRVRHAAHRSSYLSLNGRGGMQTGGVFTSIQLTGTNHTVREVTVLQGGTIQGKCHEVSLFLPRGVAVEVTGSCHRVTQTHLSWSELAARLKL